LKSETFFRLAKDDK